MKKPAKGTGGRAGKARAEAGASTESRAESGDTGHAVADVAGTDVAAGDAPAGVDAPAGDNKAGPTPASMGPEEQLAEVKDRLLRAMAETENVRRRAERDREEAQKYAVTGLARDLVGIVDNLHRAIEAGPGDGGSG